MNKKQFLSLGLDKALARWKQPKSAVKWSLEHTALVERTFTYHDPYGASIRITELIPASNFVEV